MRTPSLLSIAFIAACSSSEPASAVSYADIGGSQVTCATSGPTSGRASCNDCQVTHCKAEMQAMTGTDPTKLGGACGAWLACQCECPSGDDACAATCGAKADASCQSAMSAWQSCIAAGCTAACGF